MWFKLIMTGLLGSSNKFFISWLLWVCMYVVMMKEGRMCLAPHIENSCHCTGGTLQIKYIFWKFGFVLSTSVFYQLILKVLSTLRYYNPTFSYLRINTPKRWMISWDPREISSRMSLGWYHQGCPGWYSLLGGWL